MDVSMRRGVSIRLLTHEESQSGTSLPSTGQPVTHSDSFLVGLRAGLMKKKGCGRGAGCKPYPLPVCCSSVHTGLFPTYTHRDRKVTAHSTLTHLLWRKNHFQNVTWLLKGSVSNGISWSKKDPRQAAPVSLPEPRTQCLTLAGCNFLLTQMWKLRILLNANEKEA